MADELNFSGAPGLTMVAEIYAPNWVQQGVDVAMTEGAAGLYSASVPGAPVIADGRYTVLFRDDVAGLVLARGDLLWTDNAEIDLEHINAMLESNQVFDFGALTLAYNRRTTGAPLIPVKNVLGQKQDVDSSLIE